jgi:plastocyanin
MRQLLTAALIALVLTACYDGPAKPGPGDGSTLDFTSKATIVVDDNGIQPAVTTGRVGDAITVVNHGTKDHGLTSETIDTGTLRPGESTTVFLTATGTIEVTDRADPAHSARIEVSDAPGSS